MVRQFDHADSMSNENSIRSQTTIFDNESPNSPLDLSRTSTRFPFVHRSTSIDNSPPSPINTSVKASYFENKPMSIDDTYDPPEIIIQPKDEWHYRSIKDLAKKHIPFISGDGPQRTPVRVKVPRKSDQKMYLGISVVTYDRQPHDSKVIVPAKTKVNKEHISHDNNLDCLQFDDCISTDYYHPTTRHVYLQINEEEHKAQLKDIRIYMFNLYQNQTITKDIIETKQLHLCRLAFWLCFLDNNCFMPISPCSFSSIIRENKTSTRSYMSKQITNHMNGPNPYSMTTCIGYFNQDDTNNDDNKFVTFSMIRSL